MNNFLFEHQKIAANQLKNGSILCGSVGSGKSRTALTYYSIKESGKDLYIITTAKKRDSLDWEKESELFSISKLVVDSWNNIKKYIIVKNSFFIFDEQRLVGSGAWVKSFLQIAKNNNWILLSATPGDTWLDYIPVFIANGFYKNRTDFIRRHVVYNTFVKFPKVDRYVEEGRLMRLRKEIIVFMPYTNKVVKVFKDEIVLYDKELVKQVLNRWNPYKNEPIKQISEFCYTMRKVVNSDSSRIEKIKELQEKHQRLIIFYNFDYELEILRTLKKDLVEAMVSEYNGHKHELLPETKQWIYLVQYISGAEGWNCITANTIVFYSLNYSYRLTIQAAGRIDRINTPFATLYYYYLKSDSYIDNAIWNALSKKETFNENSIRF